MFLTEAKGCPALKSLALISDSVSQSVVIFEPRYVNCLTSSIISPCRMIGTSERWFILMCLIFFVLNLSPSIEAVACMSVLRWAKRQISSAKSRSLG